MSNEQGLRELKKLRTREAISSAAVRLFLEHGYDAVSVTDIAAAAEVSKPTLFKYFPRKEDLVLDRIEDHRDELARVVRSRPPGESPLAALHRHHRELLTARDPVTGLNDDPAVVGFHHLVHHTPSLDRALLSYVMTGIRTLADALEEAASAGDGHAGDGRAADGHGGDGHGGDGRARLTAELVANQVMATVRTLGTDTWRMIADGHTADETYPAAVAALDHAYALLRGGAERYFH